ncbi:hypothetical protein [Mycobacterium sp. 141]|uniref:hypothetical protein n=1 Tax=Mycobacterium sp. 141 TaxID=1120797 RepID=UPI0012DF270B|nr:hypothetical protein [Mycobacterium sp. 141]
MDDGVPESATTLERKEKDAVAKNNWIGSLGRRTIDEESVQKNMGDSLFKILEEELEALGILHDLSEEVAGQQTTSEIMQRIRPGSLIRITAPGTLFHPGQLSHSLVGIATAAYGVSHLVGSAEPETLNIGKQRKSGQPGKGRTVQTGGPEDALSVFPDPIPMLDISRDFVAGIIQFVRGTFSDGVHLHLRPQGVNGPIITARLEDGRRFLDSTPEILFSRYGLGEQEWTLVGTVGQLGSAHEAGYPDIADADGNMNRAAMVKLVETFLGHAGEVGLIDLPASSGFSVVPLAVYRAIGWE